VRTEQGKLHLLVAIDRTTEPQSSPSLELHEKATRRIAAAFQRHFAATVPHRVDTVLTDNGTHFADPIGDGWRPENISEMRANKLPFLCHALEGVCADFNIIHRLTKPRHPWTNG
jgi:transposase InsO family protein